MRDGYDDYYEPDFDDDSDDEYEAIRDHALVTGQSYDDVYHQLLEGTLSRSQLR